MGAGGRRFESGLPDHEFSCGSSTGSERLVHIEEVVGSNPIRTTSFATVVQWRGPRPAKPVIWVRIPVVAPRFLPDGVMVAQRTLNPLALVPLQVGQPSRFIRRVVQWKGRLFPKQDDACSNQVAATTAFCRPGGIGRRSSLKHCRSSQGMRVRLPRPAPFLPRWRNWQTLEA